MKLTKISLAALVALGAFSSVASATPLEDAIKNVDLSGFARYRYTNEKTTPAVGDKETDARHQFKMLTTFKAALDDNFFGVLGLRYSTTDGSGSTNGDRTDTTDTFRVNEFYLGYKRDNTTVTLGKQIIGSYFTDDEAGTGIKVINTDIKGLTLAAIAFDALEYSGETDSAIPQVAFSNNLYGVAAIGSYDPVNFQLWYAMLVDVANAIAADVSFGFDISDDVNLGLQAQYGNVDVDDKVAALYKDTNFYATEAAASIFGVDLSLGYIGWKVKDKAKGFSTLEDQGSFISYGEQTFDYTDLEGRGNFWFATAGYGFGDFSIAAEYIKGDIKDDADKKTKMEEYVGRFSYDYSSKLVFESWYSHAKTKVDSSKTKSDAFRFEAKYSF
ncbi:major outer membrane protein [Campylobacter sp. RM16187]|uniref:major outer membrane protein n=1 Tax=Campylobacter sp. RM16187 TaxID=1660063 RepID=UPI0021B582B5|nr:major outer membrane protein [Campylobacter sp. RM16187]QKG29756.1 major outer membrane protein [Campylobacter sp. RM16187]